MLNIFTEIKEKTEHIFFLRYSVSSLEQETRDHKFKKEAINAL